MKTLIASLIITACVYSFAQSVADQQRSNENNKASAAGTGTKQEINAQAGQYSATMRYMNYLERATITVPSPASLSELYLKGLGKFQVTCETNRRSGIISYRVEGCQKTNLPAVFFSLRQMQNRTRIRQGTNSVTVDIKLPTTQ